MIGFRVDANENIASGHLMRCMSIALECMEKGIDCKFYLAEDKMTERLKDNNLSYTILNSRWDDLSSEKELMAELVRRDGLSCLIVDSYQVTDEYLSFLDKVCPVVYIDDMANETYHVSTVIHYGQWIDDVYVKGYKNTGTTVLTGPEYIPLRKEFSKSAGFEKRDKSILLTTGGTDTYNVTRRVLEKISQDNFFNDYRINAIVGKFYKNIDEIKSLSEKNGNIKVYSNINNISDYMQECCAAVSAGGTTIYELCALKTPTVCFSFADNQEAFVKRLAHDGIMICAGDARYNEHIEDDICNGLKRIIEDERLRKNMILKMSESIDGKGAGRIADYIFKIGGKDA
ncbi:MAG: UDP-2,4-diacetamido-2,4,6-trideoxy-beta-L-altropyranose hydrolase [Lachnospiraceae bacterium]